MIFVYEKKKYLFASINTRKLEEITKVMIFCGGKVREKQNVCEVFFLFLFFISKAHNMRLKNLTFVFDENASFSFYGPSKFFRFGDIEHFFLNFRIFESKESKKI
jgi:hypothetical protein